SNVVEYKDAYFSLIYTTGGGDQRSGACLFRLNKLDPPWRWLAFSGKAFDVEARDPYGPPPHSAPCRPVGAFPNHVASVVLHQNTFIATFSQGDTVQRTTSADLISWTAPQKLMDIPGSGSTNC